MPITAITECATPARLAHTFHRLNAESVISTAARKSLTLIALLTCPARLASTNTSQDISTPAPSRLPKAHTLHSVICPPMTYIFTHAHELMHTRTCTYACTQICPYIVIQMYMHVCM